MRRFKLDVRDQPMKKIDLSGMTVVHAGEDWAFSCAPCSKSMSRYLEYNERIVSWIQPVSGSLEDQVPALRINGEYYQLSLRMMKSIWRHVRLKKDFVNSECAPYGGSKLRIPASLFSEKMRTQNRFKLMRMEKRGKQRDSAGASVTHASGKIQQTVERALFPVLSAEIEPRVSFRERKSNPMVTELCSHLQQQGDEVDKRVLLAELSKILERH